MINNLHNHPNSIRSFRERLVDNCLLDNYLVILLIPRMVVSAGISGTNHIVLGQFQATIVVLVVGCMSRVFGLWSVTGHGCCLRLCRSRRCVGSYDSHSAGRYGRSNIDSRSIIGSVDSTIDSIGNINSGGIIDSTIGSISNRTGSCGRRIDIIGRIGSIARNGVRIIGSCDSRISSWIGGYGSRIGSKRSSRICRSDRIIRRIHRTGSYGSRIDSRNGSCCSGISCYGSGIGSIDHSRIDNRMGSCCSGISCYGSGIGRIGRSDRIIRRIHSIGSRIGSNDSRIGSCGSGIGRNNSIIRRRHSIGTIDSIIICFSRRCYYFYNRLILMALGGL
mmetsp:Transcript_4590/g.11491  ORF Transcript_4590/g.11491 Transcript_4590/m.11491 type:complete len:334 (+) Transcript_4590:1583-2584(+)